MDKLVLAFDRAARTLSGVAQSRRTMPGMDAPDGVLNETERRNAIELMRVNHAGEVAAQALYQGQAFVSRSASLNKKLNHAADEELDHLAWTRDRLRELGGRASVLDPVWYIGSFAIGAAAGALGDKVSLGFLQATEEQVEAHLASHLNELPANDIRSRAIVAQMKKDEAEHAQTARALGAGELPRPIQALMRLSSKVMTRLAAKI